MKEILRSEYLSKLRKDDKIYFDTGICGIVAIYDSSDEIQPICLFFTNDSGRRIFGIETLWPFKYNLSDDFEGHGVGEAVSVNIDGEDYAIVNALSKDKEIIIPLKDTINAGRLLADTLTRLSDTFKSKEDTDMKTYIRISELVRVVLGEDDENYELIQTQYFANEDRYRAHILNVREHQVYFADYTEDDEGLHFTDFVNGFTVNQNDFNTVIQLGEER